MINESLRFDSGDQVRNERFGIGRVEFDKGQTVLVRFEHGLEECEKTALQKLWTPQQALGLSTWHSPLELITKTQALAIESVNDQWGVFSRSRIALLPHQLWVCKRVIETWPTRWLVADDVGLGKTIEAGLILWPLLSKGSVKRLLIICPASLVEQWLYRLRTMFDIRLAQYSADADTTKADFWGTHNQVVASLQTLRADNRGRHERMFEADPWDLLIVDEAHHLNADEEAGPTLGYKLVHRLVEDNRVASMVFFTGTPHRGKNYGFLSLLRLLRPDLFDARRPMREQLSSLREVMIRNNKQNVTDLKGNRIFTEPHVASETYSYSPAEARFYRMLTEFITTGKAYATSLSSSDRRMVMLVLIAMQKLASSSVAAIRRALKGRLSRIVKARERLGELRAAREAESLSRLSNYEAMEREGEFDTLSSLEEEIAILSADLRLMGDEEPRLRELVAAADEVREETKITKILTLVESRFASRHVLFFTEYKATQSLLMSALMQRYGNDCVTFINGDNRADEVIDNSGTSRSIHEGRETAAERFNVGKVRFLISTEAGGEGIDLQENCHSLIHADLPWNPMRLHQRVGRINRYGQTRQVEVISLRNPDTVESRIWFKLNEKIDNIMMALREVMDEPEDLLQLVLGMTSPTVFRELFTEGGVVSPESFGTWFDQKTAQFGGRDVIQAVKDLVGHCTRFDYQQVSSELPPLDLGDLKPFFLGMMSLNNRRVTDDKSGLSFKTPEAWVNEVGVRSSYEDLIFDRNDRTKDAAKRVLGVGHKLFNKALAQAKDNASSVATVPLESLPAPLFVYVVSDRVTDRTSIVRSVVIGVIPDSLKGSSARLLKDWEVLQSLNELLNKPGVRRARSSVPPEDMRAVERQLAEADDFVHRHLVELSSSFKVPQAELVSVFWPTHVQKVPESE